MKKLILFFVLSFVLALLSNAQTALSEGFEGATFPPDYWKVTSLNNNQKPKHSVSDTNSCVSISYQNSWLITPKLQCGNADYLQFSVRRDAGNTNAATWEFPVVVKISTTNSDTASFTEILDTIFLSIEDTAWQKVDFDLSSFQGDNIYIAFTRGQKGAGTAIYIDSVIAPPMAQVDCWNTQHIYSQNVTSTDAIIHWTNMDNSEFFTVYLAGAGNTQQFTVFDTIFTVSQQGITLNTTTTYTVYILSGCNTDILQANSISFRTHCPDEMTFPWTDDFEDYPAFPDCMFRPNPQHDPVNNLSGTELFPNVLGSSFSHWGYTGESSFRVGSWGIFDDTSTNYNYAVFPKIERNINDIEFYFYWSFNHTQSYRLGRMDIGIMTDPMDTTTFIFIDSISSYGWERKSYSWNKYYTTFDSSLVSGTDKYIAVRQQNIWFRALDAVVIDTIDACAPPLKTSVYTDNISFNNATVHFKDNDPNHNQWQIYYKPMDSTNYQIITTNDTVTVLNNLTINTEYELYIKTVCSIPSNDNTFPIKFRTLQQPVTMPYFTDFSNDIPGKDWIFFNETDHPNYNLLNKWYIGIPNGFTDSCLYVSGNGGTSRYYDNVWWWRPNYVFAQKLIKMNNADTIKIEFDLNVGGEADLYDFMRVFLVPTDIVFHASDYFQDLRNVDTNYAAEFQNSGYTYINFFNGHATAYAVNPAHNGYANLVIMWLNDEGDDDEDSRAPVIDNLTVEHIGKNPCVDIIVDTTVVACERYFFKDEMLNESGVYYDTLQTFDGCDSIIALNLVLGQSYNISIEDTVDETGIQEGYVTTVTDTFLTSNGCDSIITTNTYHRPDNGLNDIQTQVNISLFPNPATKTVTIHAMGDIIIVNNLGQIVKVLKDIKDEITIDIKDWERGIYYVKVGKATKKLIIE